MDCKYRRNFQFHFLVVVPFISPNLDNNLTWRYGFHHNFEMALFPFYEISHCQSQEMNWSELWLTTIRIVPSLVVFIIPSFFFLLHRSSINQFVFTRFLWKKSFEFYSSFETLPVKNFRSRSVETCVRTLFNERKIKLLLLR